MAGYKQRWCIAIKRFVWFCHIISKCLLKPKCQILFKIKMTYYFDRSKNLPWLWEEVFKYFIHHFKQGQQAWGRVLKCFSQQILTLKTPQMCQYLHFSEDLDCIMLFLFSCVQGWAWWFWFLHSWEHGYELLQGHQPFRGGGFLCVVGLLSVLTDRCSA